MATAPRDARIRLIAAAIFAGLTVLGYYRLTRRIEDAVAQIHQMGYQVGDVAIAPVIPKLQALRNQRSVFLLCGGLACAGFALAAWRSARSKPPPPSGA